MDALTDYSFTPLLRGGGDIGRRLKQQMQAEALQPLSSEINDGSSVASLPTYEWSSDTLQEATQFFRLNVCQHRFFL
jgi:hypothetical protein